LIENPAFLDDRIRELEEQLILLAIGLLLRVRSSKCQAQTVR